MPGSMIADTKAETQAEPAYLSGFGNEFATEAVAGALPVGQNAPPSRSLGRHYGPAARPAATG